MKGDQKDKESKIQIRQEDHAVNLEREKEDLLDFINANLPKEYLDWLKNLDNLTSFPRNTVGTGADWITVTNAQGAFYADQE